MAKTSAIERDKRRRKMVARFANRRTDLKRIASDESLTLEERFQARLRLAKLPRNSSAVRLRNRCEVSGRPRGYYRKLRMSRIALRDLSGAGLIPGMVKSSW